MFGEGHGRAPESGRNDMSDICQVFEMVDILVLLEDIAVLTEGDSKKKVPLLKS